ncbi:MAG: sigma-70 family RNA polymerase sigma factor [Chloroflexi bacterium]|nr:sigma-70 family RNA polymerase sigma factor [Chloroflexota bacterium]
MAEQELVQGSQSGDLISFNRLVETYQAAVHNVALRMLGNVQAAEDATQDAFLRAYRNIRQFRGGSFRGWLFRIVTNVCHDQMRASQRHPASSLDALTSSNDDGPGMAFPDTEELPEDYALRRELGDLIATGIRSLPEDQRWAVVLSDVEGLSYEEIASATSSSVGTVKSRLSRGRARLRDYLLSRKELLPDSFRLYK